MSEHTIEFYNVLFIRCHDLPYEENRPEFMSEGGICEHGIYFQNIIGKLQFQPISFIVGLQFTPVGGPLDYLFGNLIYTVFGFQKSEDPEEGVGLIHAIMCDKAAAILKKKGVGCKLMTRDLATNMESLFERIVCNEKTKNYKKNLNRWVSQKHFKAVSI